MAETLKIVTFENEVEAKLLSGLLDEMKIPHLLRTYHDSALDGSWQTPTHWGHLEAPEQFKDEILRIYNEMSKPGNLTESL
ncbi:MAG TPA: hypothetical protein VHO50_14270 [Bacteroidales bacterium]|nr:hypothetical protein [Bacteroidales bacterium]